jgi:predicted transcriptional regulator of viral defense system
VKRHDDTQQADLSGLVDSLQGRGRYHVTREEALRSLEKSPTALKSSTRRLAAKGRVVSLHRGFLVIIPTEYRTAGAPPPTWFIDALMQYVGQPHYYVGLLSAAALHGAAHQQPQEFQVMVGRPMRPARAGRARIRYFTKRYLERTPVVRMNTETGTMRVSSAEATAIDLVRYAPRLGHVETIITVLSALSERIDGKRLVKAAEAEDELAPVQRLGYLLERVGAASVARPLARWFAGRDVRVVPLRPDTPQKGARRDARWSLAINAEVDVEA